jgi:hypothetical protein
MPNIPTDRVHVAAIEGATVEEIEWGIENGWLPTKTAYTIVHGGRAEVMEDTTLTGISEANSKAIGAAIGGIYDTLKTKRPNTSVIFSGIIPPANHSIPTENINYINGDDGIKSGTFGTAIDDNHIKMIQPASSTGFKNQTNAFINSQPTNVAMNMLKSNSIFLANKKMDYKYYMVGSAGVSVTFLGCKRRGVSHLFWDSLTRVV